MNTDFYEQQFLENTVRDSEGKFVVKLLTKPKDLSKLVNNQDIVVKRFSSLEKWLERKPDIKFEYMKFIREYLVLEHMHEVDSSVIDDNALQYCLPHGCLVK